MRNTKLNSPIRFMLTFAMYALVIASNTPLAAVELSGPAGVPARTSHLDSSRTFNDVTFLDGANGVTFDVFEAQQPVAPPLALNSPTSAFAAGTAVGDILNAILPSVPTAIGPKAESQPNLNCSFPFTPPPVDMMSCQMYYDSGSVSWQRMPPLGGLTLSRYYAGADNFVRTQAAPAGSTLPVLGAMALAPIGIISLARFRKKQR